MRFMILPGEYSVYRYTPEHIPSLDLAAHEFVCVTRTAEEVSVVCPSGLLASAGKAETGWRILKIQGPLDFGLVGVLAEASRILAAAKVSVFAISTFDTDYLLVKADRLDDAKAALEGGGHSVIHDGVIL